MKHTILPLLLVTAPMFAGEVAPVMAPPPASPCDCPQGWTLGLEVLALKPYQSEGDYEKDGDYDAGFRGSIGYEFGDCLFVKASGFVYDTDFDQDDDYSVDLNTAFVDITVGQHFMLCDKLTLSPYVGLCWANFDEKWDSDSYFYDYDFDGLGVVIGIDGTRALGNNLSLYGKVKQAIVFGTTDDTEGYRGEGSDTDESDNVAFITEIGLGLQYDFSFSNIAANVRAGVEGQWWGGVSDSDSENVGFAGFVLGANFRF